MSVILNQHKRQRRRQQPAVGPHCPLLQSLLHYLPEEFSMSNMPNGIFYQCIWFISHIRLGKSPLMTFERGGTCERKGGRQTCCHIQSRPITFLNSAALVRKQLNSVSGEVRKAFSGVLRSSFNGETLSSSDETAPVAPSTPPPTLFTSSLFRH